MPSLRFYQDDASEWRWRVRANNGRIVADSGEGYKRKRDAEHGAQLALDGLDVGLNGTE